MALKLSPVGRKIKDLIKSESTINLHKLHRLVNNIGANNQAETISHAKIIEVICYLKKEGKISIDFEKVVVKNTKLK